MSWDIYGNPLRPGHCEAHPDIAQHFPCSICRQAQEQEKLERIHNVHIQEFHAKKKEEREKLRDQFAMAALQGLVASLGAHDVTDFHELAADAYKLADAMMKERVK